MLSSLHCSLFSLQRQVRLSAGGNWLASLPLLIISRAREENQILTLWRQEGEFFFSRSLALLNPTRRQRRRRLCPLKAHKRGTAGLASDALRVQLLPPDQPNWRRNREQRRRRRRLKFRILTKGQELSRHKLLGCKRIVQRQPTFKAPSRN